MNDWAQTRRRRRRIAWITRGVILVVAAGLFFTGFHFFDRATRKPLTVEQQIRAAVADYLDACRERDHEEIRELHTRKVRPSMGTPPPDGDPAATAVPADPSEWFLWRLPVRVLDRLEIHRLEKKWDGGALVELRPNAGGSIGMRRCRIEFILSFEDDEWRFGTCSLYLTETLLVPPVPPAEERGKLPDGRRFLTLGVTEKPPAGIADTVPVLILRVNREIRWGDLKPLIEAAVAAGVSEIRIRPERRIRAVRGTWVLFFGHEATTVVSGDQDLKEIVYPLPAQPETVDMVIGIGRRADTSEHAGALPFEAVIGPESSRALARFTNLLERPLSKLDLILSIHPTTDLARIANVWHGLAERGARGVILATENPLGAGYGSALLLNGLRPDQIMRTTPETLPRVWPDNPVLTRTIARRQ